MCGIAGLFSFSQLSNKYIASMTDVIRHRGPDDEGFFLLGDRDAVVVCGGVDTPASVYASAFSYTPSVPLQEIIDGSSTIALGHRRLSIVDVSAAGHQPMCSNDKRLWIVYNGEIYNHVELREELQLLGAEFVSHSDTEVILTAYRYWGQDCLQRFNGMFSFILYDKLHDTVFIARDRFGVKPLYYWFAPDGVAFASEIKQFCNLPGWQPVMNEQRVYDFLNWGVTDHTDETLFKGVFQLKAGQSVHLSHQELLSIATTVSPKLPVYNWYALTETPFNGSFEQAADGFRERFTDAVKLRLRADVSVGSCLSGGLDSSSIVAVMHQLMDQAGITSLQKTFSACSSVKRFDESEYIKEVVEKIGVNAHYTSPSLDELFHSYERITWHQDEPFGSTSIFAQWKVFELASKMGVKVMLDGQGADEQLAGYHTFFGPYLASLFQGRNWGKLWNQIQAIKKVHGYSELTAIKYLANMLLPESVRQILRRFDGRASSNPEWLNMRDMKAAPTDPFAELGGKAASLKAYSKSQLTATNLQMLLHWEDRNSMAHSIESRVPFLDYRLVEYVLGLPDHHKLGDGVTKLVLRESMKNILPEKVRMRMDKLGFVTPEEVWLREDASAKFREALIAAIEASQGMINNKIINFFDEIIAGSRPFSFLIWRVVSFGMWVKQFNVIRDK